MHRHALASIVAVALAAACSSSSEDNPATTPLDIVTSAGSGAVPGVTDGVKADGESIVTITVNGATAAPVRVNASRGTFANGTNTAIVQSTSATLELQVCDARTDAQCVGNLTITAFDGGLGYGQKRLTLIGFESSCTNNRDDNSDQRSDCADPDCDAKTCGASGGAAGTCQSGVCMLPTCTPTAEAEICSNSTDDDCDRKIDCAQTSCEGQPCRTGSPAFACRAGACTDAATGMAITVTPRRTRLPADGVGTTTVSLRVTKLGAPQSGQVIDVSTNLGAFVVGDTSPMETAVTTASDGVATVTYRSAAVDGVARITARLHDNQTITDGADITMPQLGSITVGAVQNPVMGVKFSGFNEQNQLSVQLLDNEQKPYPDGLEVRFEHQQLGGSTISTPFAADTSSCVRDRGCLGFIGQTQSPQNAPDTTGLAPLTLYSGTAAGPVSVTVSATVAGVTRTFTLQNVVIVGAKASGKNVSVFCTPQSVPAFALNDCTNSFLNTTVPCTVFLADRFNNVLGVAVRADFRTEAGSPGPPVSTRPYDPVMGGDQTAELGKATNTVAIMGYRLPRDVPPIAGEHNLNYDSGCGTRVHNPRDGLSTVMVAVQGEEGFVDINGNGVYQVGEPFVDAGEPFVDENDNNVRDNDEAFIDVDQDGSWDPPNGKWDADTVVWAETRMTYTDGPELLFPDRQSKFVAIEDEGKLPGPTPVPSLDLLPDELKSFRVWFTDRNFNPLAVGATFAVGTLNDRVETVLTGPAQISGLGMSFTQQFCDPQNPTACESTCRLAPCYRQTRVSGFQYGNKGTVTIKAGGVDKLGPVSVSATGSAGGASGTVTIGGQIAAPPTPPE